MGVTREKQAAAGLMVKNLPRAQGKSMGPCQLTPKENRPRALPLKDPSPVLHQPRSQYEGMAWGAESLYKRYPERTAGVAVYTCDSAQQVEAGGSCAQM